MEKKLNKIVKDLSLSNYVPVEDVQEVVKSQFSLVKKVISSAEHDKPDTFKTIMLPFFGKFLVHKGVIEKIIKNKNK